MANITKKTETAPQTTAMEWDPFRMMREWLRWDPFREMQPSFARLERMPELLVNFEVKESKDAYVFKADVPGVKDSDIDISLTGNRLCIAGKRESEKSDEQDTYYTYERSFGSFSRSFTLPEGVDADHIRTDLKEGVLTVVLPKRPEMQAKKIEVKASGAKQ